MRNPFTVLHVVVFQQLIVLVCMDSGKVGITHTSPIRRPAMPIPRGDLVEPMAVQS
jgi:hypothetical protein